MCRSRLAFAVALCALLAAALGLSACRRKGTVGSDARAGGSAAAAAAAAKARAAARRRLTGARPLPLRPLAQRPSALAHQGSHVTLAPLDAARGFASLTVQRRVAAYHIAQAAEAADRVLWLQHQRDALALKDLLETLLLVPGALEGETRRAVTRCLSRQWLHHGPYDLARSSKRVCRGFDVAALQAAMTRADSDGYDVPARTPVAVAALLRRSGALLFDPTYAFRLTVDFYRGVTLDQARSFPAKHPHQALLASGPSGITEHPFRSGRGAVREGFYVNELHHAVKHLVRAKPLLEGDERAALEATIDLLQLADPAARRRLERLLLSDKVELMPLVGFFPTLRDPLDQRAIYAGGVAIADAERTRALQAALRLGGALASRLPGTPRSKVWPRGRAVRLLYAAGALGPLSHGAALFVPGTPTFLLLDTPGPLLWRLQRKIEGPLCKKRIGPMWVGLRQSLGTALARSAPGGKTLAHLPSDGRAQARADAALLWLAEGDKTLQQRIGGRCAEQLLPAYVAACAEIERAACAPVLEALRQAGALSEAQRATARPRARQALRALVLGHSAQLQGKAASQPASRPAARRGPIERRAILSPVLIAVREKSGLVRDVQVRWPRDWVAYNLARARAWRLQSGRPLKRGKTVVLPSRAGRFPGRVPLRLLRRSKTKTTK